MRRKYKCFAINMLFNNVILCCVVLISCCRGDESNTESLLRLWKLSKLNNIPSDQIKPGHATTFRNGFKSVSDFTPQEFTSLDVATKKPDQARSTPEFLSITENHPYTLKTTSMGIHNSSTYFPYSSTVKSEFKPSQQFTYPVNVEKAQIPVDFTKISTNLQRPIKQVNSTYRKDASSANSFTPRVIPLDFDSKYVTEGPSISTTNFIRRNIPITRNLANPKTIHEASTKSSNMYSSTKTYHRPRDHQRRVHASPSIQKRVSDVSTENLSAASSPPQARGIEDYFTARKGAINKKFRKYMLPLLLAYKLKFFTLVPLLMGGLVLLAGSTGLAGFFFALFAAVMGLKSSGHHH